MAKYEGLFEAFGPSVLGRVAGATAIGLTLGIAMAVKVSSSPNAPGWWWFVGGGGAVGLLVGGCLGMAEVHGNRVRAGVSKPLSGRAVAFIILGAIALFFIACWGIVFW